MGNSNPGSADPPPQSEYIHATHFGDVIGLEHLEAPEGTAVIELPVKQHLCNRYGTIHGGVTMALMDAAGLWAGAPKTGSPPRTTTVSLNCNFMRAAGFDTTKTLHASAELIKRGRSLYFSSITVRAGKGGPVIASGQGVYSTPPASDKSTRGLPV